MKPIFLIISLSFYLQATPEPHATELHTTEPHTTEPHTTEPHAAEPHAAETHNEAAPPVNAVSLDVVAAQNLGIQTAVVALADFDDTTLALGRIERIPARHAVVSSRISGRVVALTAHEGDRVTVGQSLAKVESRQPGTPSPVIDLPAPIDGMVTASLIRLGEPVEPDRNLMEITDLSAVWAVARVPDHFAARIEPGSEARISVAATGGLPSTGKLRRFGTSADPQSGTLDAIFQLPNDTLRLLPGMRAEFEILLTRRKNVLSIPREAVQGGPSSRHVFVKSSEIPNTYLRTPVRTGPSSGDRVEILSGLAPGNLVVTTGSYPLGFVSGGGTTSLKEALDAVHGHEHSEDGTCASSAGEGAAPAEHEHEGEAESDKADHSSHSHP